MKCNTKNAMNTQIIKIASTVFTIYLLVIPNVLYSQTTFADMENITLQPNSYLDGFSNPGNNTWTSGNCEFRNYYDVAWEKGFAVSNLKDSLWFGNPNSYNQFASKPLTGGYVPMGGGAMSDNYLVAIGYGNGATVKFTTPCNPKTINIAPTFYNIKIMREGDATNGITKFGGVTGDDPDWFKITFRKYLGGALTNDSVEHYLADYRFASNLDFVQEQWMWVDISTLGLADSLLMYARATNGMTNYIIYSSFCVDNLETDIGPLTVKENRLSITKIYPNPVTSQLNADIPFKPQSIKMYDVAGKQVIETNTFPINISELENGVYFMEIHSENERIRKKIIVTK